MSKHLPFGTQPDPRVPGEDTMVAHGQSLEKPGEKLSDAALKLLIEDAEYAQFKPVVSALRELQALRSPPAEMEAEDQEHIRQLESDRYDAVQLQRAAEAQCLELLEALKDLADRFEGNVYSNLSAKKARELIERAEAGIAASPAHLKGGSKPVAWLWKCISGPYKGEIDVHSVDGVDHAETERVKGIYSAPFPVYTALHPQENSHEAG